MATTLKLLSIPLEIRRHIYSYLLPNTLNINIVRDDMDGPLRIGLIRVCRVIYLEATDYYYSMNTFLLDLSDPACAPNSFINGTNNLLRRYIRRVKVLQLIIGDCYWIFPNEHPCTLSPYPREQCEWFLKTLIEAKENHEGWWMRKLVVLDHCVTLITSQAIASHFVEGGAKRREALVQLLEPFKSRIREIKIESRAQSRIREYDFIHSAFIGIIADDILYINKLSDICGRVDLGHCDWR